MDPEIIQKAKTTDGADEFFLIRLAEKRYDFEQTNVFVGINGDAPVMLQRGVAVPITAAVIEALRNARHPVYSQKPGEDRKIVGTVERFPFEVIARLPKKKYEELRTISLTRELTEQETRAARGY